MRVRSIHARYGFAVASVRFSSVVVDDASLFGVDQQHLARLQPPLPDDLALRNVEHADLGSHDHVVVVGDDVARRPQPVAIERRADLPAVGERHRRGAVPGLHQRGVVFVECAAILVHQRIAGPRFRDHQHHRVRERIPAHQQKLESNCRTTPNRTARRRSAARSCRGRRREPCWRSPAAAPGSS